MHGKGHNVQMPLVMAMAMVVLITIQRSKHEKPFCFWVDPDFCVIAAPYVSSTSRSLNWNSDQRNDHHNNTKYQHYSLLLLLLLYEHFATFSQLASLQCSPAPRLADWLTCY